MFINGQWETGAAVFEVYNPATGEAVGSVPDGTRADAARAIDAAGRAFASWSQTTAYARSELLYRAWQLMRERRDELARTMTLEQGKPLKAARNEVQYASDFLLWFAEEAKRVYGRTIPAPRPDQRFIVLHQPVGVVAAITPWNYPVSMITRKVAPALAAGCTIVLKPSEATPLCAVEVFKILHEAGIPDGVVNLVTALDPEPIGLEFVENPRVKKITFTGSTEVGKLLAGRAAAQVKRISMELGGHAPFIVLDDADPVRAAKGCLLVKFLNTGQACISPNRLLVHRSIVEPFAAEFKKRASAMKAGSGFDEGVSIGPLVNREALEKIECQVADALHKGATIETGGARLTENGLDRGFFYAPTLLNNVTPKMRIYREETFGPVAPLIAFDSDQEALAMANDTRYGLAAYIYTQDIARAMRMLEGLRFAIVGINDINPTAAAAPFGGMQESGLGREGGQEGIAEYLEVKLAGISI
ncbi:MAG: NAD-dependent succinate-semialdehyde dehydrogenase [Deltaproteobacteria bacterium]|nr:NAD-dependent succinate-semialdehyde dehydrogenase [Deltaproteobacteria bacterium]